MKAPPAMAAPQNLSLGDDVALASAKAEARTAALARRAGLNPASGARLAGSPALAALIPPGAVVAGFWPIGDEIDIRPLLTALHERGHRLALPVTGRRGEALAFRAWRPGAVLEPGRFGTSHPTGEAVTPDALLIPLLAFDPLGNRLGYGGGFYDRTLARMPGALRIGCAFAAQELDSIPTGPYDQRLHAVLTEAGLRRFPIVPNPAP